MTGKPRRVLKWLAIIGGSLLGLLLVAVAVVWIAGGRLLDQTYAWPEGTFVANPAAADLEEGRRAAILRGCFGGCHGDALEGEVFYDDFMIGRFVAPDLTRAFRELTDQQLDRAIRHGVRSDGRTSVIMPSTMFHHLSDTDLNNITAFIRSQPPTDGPEFEVWPGLLARFLLLRMGYVPQAEQIRDEAPWLTDTNSPGEYLAMTLCSECHGLEFQGREGFGPDLVMTTAYSLGQFTRLMREGIAVGGNQLNYMAEVSLSRFSHLTDGEIAALHAFLQSLARTD